LIWISGIGCPSDEVRRTDVWSAATAYHDGAEPLYEEAAPEPLLFFPATGYRDKEGTLDSTGWYGDYMSSTVNGTYNYVFNIQDSFVQTYDSYRATGHSVRCVAK
jgi:hypothetical protein